MMDLVKFCSYFFNDYQNKLIDYQIEQISNNDSNSNIANNMLVKYKKIDVLPILEFNNLQNFNNI